MKCQEENREKENRDIFIYIAIGILYYICNI